MTLLTSGLRPYLLLALIVLAVALPGIAAVPPLDRDESRFAVASREMLETGDYIRIQYQDEMRAKKPAGIYWLQAAAARLSGHENAIWPYRIPSVLGILLAVLLTFGFGQALVGREAALLGAALLACAPLVVSEAHQAKTDAMLLACAVAAQGVLGRLYLHARATAPPPPRWAFLIFWIAQAAGILLKGPIVPLLSGLTVITLAIADRRVGSAWLRALRPVPGLALTALLVAPWAIAISRATSGQFIGEAVSHDLLLKLIDPPEAHEGWAGTYLLAAAATLWPCAAFALPGFVRAVAARREPAMRFFLAWIVPFWLLFELVPTKLPHYVLPTYPALALLAGMAILRGDELFKRWWARAYLAIAALVGAALAAAALALPIVYGGGFVAVSIPAAAAALIAGLAPALLAWRGRFVGAAAFAVAAASLTWLLLFLGIAPGLDQLWLSRSVAELVPRGAPAATAGFREPSLVFLLGTHTLLTDGAGAAAFLSDKAGAVAVVESAETASFQARLAVGGQRARQLGEIDGLNYSRGKPTHLGVWMLAAP